jgi:hypothetical protein
MCLVFSWKESFLAMWIADKLSQKRLQGLLRGRFNEVSRLNIHCISQVVTAKALYSASAEEREGHVCFFAFHEIRADP